MTTKLEHEASVHIRSHDTSTDNDNLISRTHTHGQSSRSASQLPSDLLRPIFLYYSSQETNEHPLENILLVCRFWYITAIEYSQLWSIFNIVIEDGPSAVNWAKRIPRRLRMSERNEGEQSGDGSTLSLASAGASTFQTPIYFSLEGKTQNKHHPSKNKGRCPTYPKYNWMSCPCAGMVDTNIPLILQALCDPLPLRDDNQEATKGNNGMDMEGKYSARWKEFNLSNLFPGTQSGHYLAEAAIAKALSFPTPILTSIQIHSVMAQERMGVAFLPHTPSLKHIRITWSCLPWLPDTSNVRTIYIHNAGPEMGYGFGNAQSLRKAHKVEELRLDMYIFTQQYNLPSQLSWLRVLHLGLRFMPSNITKVQMPNLRELSLHPFTADLIKTLVSSPGIPFGQLTTLRVQFPYKNDVKRDLLDYSVVLKSLLRACESVQKIYGARDPEWGTSVGTAAPEHGSMILILRILLEDCTAEDGDGGILCGHTISVDDGVSDKQLRAGMFDQDIDEYLEERGWLDVKEPWEVFARRWN
jgi:hypothetical protein